MERSDRFLRVGQGVPGQRRRDRVAAGPGNCVNLHVRERDYQLRGTMTDIEARLDPTRFLRRTVATSSISTARAAGDRRRAPA